MSYDGMAKTPPADTADSLREALLKRGHSPAEAAALVRKKRRRKTLEFDLVKSAHHIEGPRGGDELCTVEFAAQALKVQPRTVHRFIHEGRLPARRIGKAYRIRRSDLAALSGVAAAPAPAASMTSIVDIPGVDSETARLWKKTVDTAIASRGSVADGTRAELIYDEAQRHLKIIVVGSTGYAVTLLTMIQVWLQKLRAEP